MLNADELKHGPGPRLAFLASLDAQALAEVMVAFANTEGGIIVLGLEANGQPAEGTISDAGVQKVLENAENLFNPGIVIEAWEALDIEDDFFDDTVSGRVIIQANAVATPEAVVPSANPSFPANPTNNTSLADSAIVIETSASDAPAQGVTEAQPTATPDIHETSQAQAAETSSLISEATGSTLIQDHKPAESPIVESTVISETPVSVSKPESSLESDTNVKSAVESTPTEISSTVPSVDLAYASTPDAPASSTPESVESPSPESTALHAKSEALSAGRPDAPASIIEPAPGAPIETTQTPAAPVVEAVPVVPVTPSTPAIPKPPPALYGVRIPRSIELHALNDGRVLIRSGARNRPLGGQEILRLASAKGTGEFEAEVVPGATQADFSRRMIDEYLLKRAERTKRPFSGSIDEMLLEIGALTADRRPTTAGILLFTEYPQKWLPQSSLIFARFVGTQPRGESGMAGYIRREEITGPLPRLIEAAWNLVWSEMAVSAMVSGLEREEKAEYPQFAVREAIVNSICHRDYRLRGRRIELRMYSDRLEVISPGGLPGFITVENIKDEHFSRNPRIVNGLFQWGYIEELGLGIDRMIEVMEQAGREPPHFDARPYSFAVTLNNEREKQRPLDWIRSANHRQARAMQYIHEHGSITNREYRILCAGVSAETLRLDLAGMVDRGQLIKVGSKKGTHYILRDRAASESDGASG